MLVRYLGYHWDTLNFCKYEYSSTLWTYKDTRILLYWNPSSGTKFRSPWFSSQDLGKIHRIVCHFGLPLTVSLTTLMPWSVSITCVVDRRQSGKDSDANTQRESSNYMNLARIGVTHTLSEILESNDTEILDLAKVSFSCVMCSTMSGQRKLSSPHLRYSTILL